MKLIKSLVYALLSMTTLAILASCQDEDFGYTAEDVKKGAFGRNFENEYGKIDPDQSWDLTRSMVRTSKYKPFSFGDTQTRSAIAGYEEAGAYQIATYPGDAATNDYTGWYEVQDETLTWFNEKLTEGVNHTDEGEPFSLVAPANGFAIIPIFQGQAGMDWQLHVVDKTAHKDYTIWSESQGMVRRENDNQEWSTIPTECHYNEEGLIKDQSSATFGFQIMSQPIQLNITQGHELFLYLKVVKGQWKSDGYGDGNYAKTGTEQRSDEGMMLALECPIPSNIGTTGKAGNLAMIIGCEDADGQTIYKENGDVDIPGSDWDMNDVCFLVVGYPNIPDRISYTQKRYMCEDLGNTYDFDFNDVVVDVTEATYYSAVSTPTVKDGKSYVNFQKNPEKTKQYATIAHVCGTLPFQIKVGDYDFALVSDPTKTNQTISELRGESTKAESTDERSSETAGTVGWNPNVTKEITGWNATSHNIILNVSTDKNAEVFTQALNSSGTVEEENESEHIYRITFPEKGKAPLIIAVDPTIGWMAEHQHIPETWWKDGKVFEQNAGSGSDSQHGSDLLSMEVTSLPWDDVRQLSYGEGIANNLILMPTCFNTMQVGDVISFTTTGDLNLHYANPAGWVSISSGKRYAAGSNNEPGVVTLKIADATMLQNLKQYGLGINGDKVIVTHIESYTPVQYTLMVTAGDHGMISVDGGDFVKSFNQSVDEGAHTIKAKGDNGYTLDKWSDDVTTKSRLVNLTSNLTLSANFVETDLINLWEGEKNSDWNNPEFHFADQKFYAGDKIILTGEGTAEFWLKFGNNWYPAAKPSAIESGFEVTLTQEMANVLNSDHFFRITDVNGSLSITSIDLLPRPQYTVTVTSANSEQGTVGIEGKDGSTYTGFDESITIKATPAEHYKFVSWSKGGNVVSGASATYNFTLSEATAGTYTASFAEDAKYSVSITPGPNGKIKVNGTEYTTAFNATGVYEGTVYEVEAIPNDGYDFTNWSIGGAAKQSITVNGDINATANFQIKTFTLTLEATTGGKYKINGSDPVDSYTQTYNYGTEISVEAVSADEEAYTFNNWSDGEANASRTFTMTENKTVKAKFSAAGAVTILSQSILIGGNNGSHTLTPEQVQAIENAFSDGKKTIVISFSKMSGNTSLSLKTGYYQDVVVFEIKTNDESANIQLTQANIKKIKDENNSIQLVNSGSDITITSISMQ